MGDRNRHFPAAPCPCALPASMPWCAPPQPPRASPAGVASSPLQRSGRSPPPSLSLPSSPSPLLPEPRLCMRCSKRVDGLRPPPRASTPGAWLSVACTWTALRQVVKVCEKTISPKSLDDLVICCGVHGGRVYIARTPTGSASGLGHTWASLLVVPAQRVFASSLLELRWPVSPAIPASLERRQTFTKCWLTRSGRRPTVQRPTAPPPRSRSRPCTFRSWPRPGDRRLQSPKKGFDIMLIWHDLA